MQKKIEQYIYSHKDKMLSALSRLVAIPSVKGKAEENAPFGREPKRALEEMCAICGELGYTAEICENAVGSIDYCPDGEVTLGVLCHLDVVPCQPENWASDPYTLTEKDGVLYGRGVIDDKGPAVAALYAIHCIKELGLPLKNGVRLIFGTDEENGSEDMELYRKNKAFPKNVFTPDGSFPVINVEKGMMRSTFRASIPEGRVRCFHGGSIPNAVPDSAYAEVKAELSEINAVMSSINAEFHTEQLAEYVRITAVGKSAHASTPEGGVNAVTALVALLSMLNLTTEESAIFCNLNKAFPFGETDGASVGLKAADETGALTLVFSIFDMEQGKCSGTVDVRFPTCLSLAVVEQREREALAAAGCEFVGYMGDEPHCVDENSEFVQSLLRVYERIEGEKGCCIAIGGGTYVHNIEGGVAFGAERGDTDYHMHGADEFIPVDELLKDTVLFANAIAEICG